MALFHTTVVDNQIKALDTIGTASGSVATFDTDRAERLVSCVCEVASGSEVVSVFVNTVNIWNELWESGTYNTTTGEKASWTNALRSKYHIKCEPNKTYKLVSPVIRNWAYFYDENKQFLSAQQYNDTYDIITPDGCYYLNFSTNNQYGATYANNISINNDGSAIYHAFNGFVVNLGETLSGNGSFDVLSGILTRSDDTTKHIDGNAINAQVGTNNIYADTGDIIDLKFVLSVGKAIS